MKQRHNATLEQRPQPPAFGARERETLDRDGYIVLRAIFDPATVAAIHARIEVLLEIARRDPLHHRGGTLHLPGDLIDDASCGEVLREPSLVAALTHLTGDGYRPSRLQFRSPLPGYGAQSLHADAAGPSPAGLADVATAIVTLTEFTAANGATLLVPGSHREYRRGVPRPGERVANGLTAVAPAGSAIVFHGHLLHGGTRNTSTERRDALQLTALRAGVQHYDEKLV